MKRVSAMVALLLTAHAGIASEEAPPSGNAAYTRSSLVAFVSSNDDALDPPLLFLAIRSSSGTVPDRYEVSRERPLLVSPKFLIPPWTERSPSYIFVVLPCAGRRQSQENAPGYLLEHERQTKQKKGYYTDVYGAQYQFGQGSEMMVLDIKNSKTECGVKAYRAKDEKAGGRLIPVKALSIDLSKVFVCEMNTPSCG